MIKWAQKEALKSTYKQHRVGAVIVKGGNILATGYNELRPSGLLKTPTLHAEASAILKLLKAGRQNDLVGSDLYVTRFTRGGDVGISKPCEHCYSLCLSVGIKRIYYTDVDGSVKRMKL